MVGKVYVRDLEILTHLQIELSQFNSGTAKVLDDVARNTLSVKEHINNRLGYWTAELRRREAALRLCQASDSYNDCSPEAAAVREAELAIEKLKRLSARFDMAFGEYLPPSNKLRDLLNRKISKAKSDLQHSIEKYQEYLDHRSHGSGALTSNPKSKHNSIPERKEASRVPDVSNNISKKSMKWAEKEAILRKIDQGILLSPEEFEKLSWPISDLKSMTLAEDSRWIEQLIESERFYDITKDINHADTLKDAILATIKTKNYWRSIK